MIRTVAAQPYPYRFPVPGFALMIIDMQRDFIEPGGFGSTLGNDVTRLSAIVPTVARLLNGFRSAGLPVIHTKEAHKPDLSDCPPGKRLRGNAPLRIGGSKRMPFIPTMPTRILCGLGNPVPKSAAMRLRSASST